MSQSQRQQKPVGMGVIQTRRTPSSRITPLNILIGFVVALILLFLVMSVLNVGPFSWGN